MCYEIRELTGKKIRENNSIQKTGSPNMYERARQDGGHGACMVEKAGAQGKRARREGKASGGGISGIAGGGGKEVFPPPIGRRVGV
jgi:hypothetical protein